MSKKLSLLIVFLCNSYSLCQQSPAKMELPRHIYAWDSTAKNIIKFGGNAALVSGLGICYTPDARQMAAGACIASIGGLFSLCVYLHGSDDNRKKVPVPITQLAKWIKRYPVENRSMISKLLAVTKRESLSDRILEQHEKFKKIRKQLNGLRYNGPLYGGTVQNNFLKLLPPDIGREVANFATTGLEQEYQDLEYCNLGKNDIEELLFRRGKIDQLIAIRDPGHAQQHENHIYCKGSVVINGQEICNSLTTAYVRLFFTHMMCDTQNGTHSSRRSSSYGGRA